MKQYKTTILGVQHDLAGAIQTVRFTVTGTDSETGAAATSAPDYAVINAPAGAPDDSLPARCAETREYAHAKSQVDAQLSSAGTPRAAPTPPTPPVIITDAEQRQVWVAAVDDTVAFMQSRVTRFQLAYTRREAAATAYRDSGYTIDPTTWITDFADPAGLTYPVAADRILAQAAAYHEALEQFEKQRMRKYLILNAADQKAAALAFQSIMAECEAIYKELP